MRWILPSKRFVGLKACCSTTVRSEWMNIQNGPSPARETMPGLVLTNSVHKDASAGVAARGLSAAAGAGVSVIQPTPGRPQISKRHRPPGLAGPAGMRCLDPRDSDCNRQKFQRAGGLAPCNSGVVPSDDRRLTVLHRREGGPSSIYFAPASQAACDPVAVRRAEHFGIGGVFSH